MRQRTEGSEWKLSGWIRGFALIIALAMSLFQIYSVLFIPPPTQAFTAIHLGFVLILVFLWRPAWKGQKPGKLSWAIDAVIILAALTALGRIIKDWGTTSPWITTIAGPEDVVLGVIITLVVLEAVRRTMGVAICIISLVFFAYALLGPIIPGTLGHSGVSFQRFFLQVYITDLGLFGMVLSISAHVITVMVIFGAFMEVCKGGEAFIDIASALFGRFRGGPAKIATVSSALIGMVQPSGMANVCTTGVFTIPMMKRIGFKPSLAASVEACASTSGAIMPPVMGAVAYIMAEFLGVKYSQVVIWATIPAWLWIMGVYFSVDFSVLKTGLKGLPREEVPSLKTALKRKGLYILPIALLLYLLLVREMSVMMSGLYSLALLLIIFYSVELATGKKISLKPIIAGLEGGAKGMMPIASICSLIGLIMYTVDMTGLGLKLSTVLVELAGGNLLLLLMFMGIASIILGTGLPVIACYILLVAVGAPALQLMGVPNYAAHFFLIYFGMFSMLTPPVAPSSYVAAGIARSPGFETALTSTRLILPVFFVPFLFVYNPGLLMIGGITAILLDTLRALVVVYFVSASLTGYLFKQIGYLSRMGLFAGACALVIPILWLNVAGISLIGVILITEVFKVERPGLMNYLGMAR